MIAGKSWVIAKGKPPLVWGTFTVGNHRYLVYFPPGVFNETNHWCGKDGTNSHLQTKYPLNYVLASSWSINHWQFWVEEVITVLYSFFVKPKRWFLYGMPVTGKISFNIKLGHRTNQHQESNTLQQLTILCNATQTLEFNNLPNSTRNCTHFGVAAESNKWYM